MQWKIPQLQFSGDIIRYEIHLGRSALEPDEEVEIIDIDIDTNDVRSIRIVSHSTGCLMQDVQCMISSSVINFLGWSTN